MNDISTKAYLVAFVQKIRGRSTKPICTTWVRENSREEAMDAAMWKLEIQHPGTSYTDIEIWDERD